MPKKEEKLKKFLLEIPEEIWEKWKNKVPRSISLNKALIALLEKEASLKEKKKRISQKEDNLVDRLSKIEKVKSELDDL